MNEHLAKAIETYEQQSINFHELLTWHLCHGLVVCDMDCFSIGFSCFKEEPLKPVEVTSGDTLFVTFTTGNMRSALEKYIQSFEFIAFQRSFKGSNRVRISDIYKIYSKLK